MLVDLYKAVRRLKRPNPLQGWREQENNYAIADRFFPRFVRAFINLNKNIIDDEVAENLRNAWNAGQSLDSLVYLIPIFYPGAEDKEKIWRKLSNKLVELYGEIINKSGVLETSQLNRKLKTNLRFTLDDGSVQQAKKIPVIPINPYSLKWISERSLSLVEEGITNTQIKTVQRILEHSFEQGLRGKQFVEEIKNNIGLTQREYNAVLRRRVMHWNQGLPKKRTEESVKKYQEKLLRTRASRIARTETITAQSHGRNVAWQLAQDSGQLSGVSKMWVSAPASPNPNRPCEICLELDGTKAKIGEQYESIFVGMLDAPPAHPGCRCTETIIRD